ncbi:MAG: Ig-like domain-containing protein [Lachnospiraceae bacterium]
MKILDQIKKIGKADGKAFVHKYWQYLIGAFVVVGLSGVMIASVIAEDDGYIPTISNTGSLQYMLDSGNTSTVSVDVVIDSNAWEGTPEELAALIQSNTVWITGNDQVATYVDGSGATISTMKGTSGTVRAVTAGATQLSVRFYYKYKNAEKTIIDNVSFDGSESGFEYVEIVVAPFICNLKTTFDPNQYTENRVYTIGSEINFTTNSYAGDPVMIKANNDVVSGGATSFNRGHITVDKGGRARAYIMTTSGYVSASDTYITGLYEEYFIIGACRIDPDTITVDPTQVGSKINVSSNLSEAADSGITYKSTNPAVATMEKSQIHAKGAGTTTISAGVADDSGNYIVYNNAASTIDSSDSVVVTVPFVWLNDSTPSRTTTQNLSVGDALQLLTNATSDSTVAFTNYNNNMISVSDSGYVTTKASGTTSVTATITYPDHTTEVITATINVGDNFALNSANVSIGVNEYYDIEAIGSAENTNISFFIDGVPADNATGGLTGATNANVLTVKGVTQGTYTVTAQMEKNGITKTATCIVTVKTQVTDVTITPTQKTMVVGEQAVLNVVVGPNSAYNRNVVWVTSDPEVVSVDLDTATADSATITAHKGGVATVTVVSVSDGTKYATCTINVSEAVTGVTLNENNVTVNMNNYPDGYYLIATVLPENTTGLIDGVNRNVIWSSTDESVLTVDEYGHVTFVAPGNAAVVVQTEDGGFTAYCNFTVTVPVEEVRISSDDLILNVGDERTLTAEVLPLTATNRTVEWISSKEDIVSIDSNGNLKALKAGTSTITCRAIDGGSNAPLSQITVLVRTPVSSVTMNTNSITVPKGTVFWLYATIRPENADLKEVVWESSDTSLATVGADGMVTALAPGVVTITATSTDNGDADYCVVTIEEAVTGITLATGDSQTLFVGAQFTIVPVIEPIDAPNKNVTYVSSNESIATVDQNGVVTALMGGECDIIVTTEERQLKAICHIYVKEYLSTITLDRTFTYINIGDHTDLIPTTTTDTATNKNIVWKTANSGIATVDETGRVTGVGYGTTVITAVAEDGGGAQATCVVQVVEPVTSITLSNKELRMIQGDTYIIGATVSPANASVKLLKWESTDPSVATVDQDGEVTAVAGGKCRIYARSTDGNDVSAYCTVYVTNITNATALALNSSAITIDIGEVRTLTVKSTPTVITEELGWYSTDTGIVTVDQNGTLVGINEGVADVVVYGKTSGVEGKCQVTVRSAVINATSVKLNSEEITMLTGKTRQLVTRLLPTKSNEKINWYSTDTSVVVVDGNGKITTVGPGHADVVAVTATTGLETSCTVHSMAISRSAVKLQQYDPFMLYVDGAPSRVSWRTNNPRIATVSSNGEVIGRKAGTTTITATVEGKTLTCTVTIVEATKY